MYVRETAALVAGMLFGLGLSVGGMVDPAKVLGFLDVAGRWDPTLAFVMAGALTVTAVGYRAVLRRRAPLLGDRFHLPAARVLDGRLIVGAAVFGVGWGLAGFCPGPAIASLGFADGRIALFVVAMAAGAGAHALVARAGVRSGRKG